MLYKCNCGNVFEMNVIFENDFLSANVKAIVCNICTSCSDFANDEYHECFVIDDEEFNELFPYHGVAKTQLDLFTHLTLEWMRTPAFMRFYQKKEMSKMIRKLRFSLSKSP